MLGLVGCAREVFYQIVPEHYMLGTSFATPRTYAADVLPFWLGFKERSAGWCNLGYQTLPFTAILEEALGLVGCARGVLYQIVPKHYVLGTWFAPQRTCAVDVLPFWLGFKEGSAC